MPDENEEKQVRVVMAGARKAEKHLAGKIVLRPASEARQLVKDGRAQYVSEEQVEMPVVVREPTAEVVSSPERMSSTSGFGKGTPGSKPKPRPSN